MRFENRRIVVTGAASGIGAASAARLAAEGAEVIGLDRAAGPGIHAVDIADADAVDAAFAGFGAIDGLVNAAGIAGIGNAQDLDLATWHRVLAVNLTGAMLTTRAAARTMADGRGAIVNVASVYGMVGGSNNVPYNAAKGGLIQLTRSAAADLAPRGIRVNAVSPGYVTTPMSALLDQDPAMREAFVGMHLLRRGGTPDEIAAAIAFLLSADASFVTGVNLPVDGGFSSAMVIPGYVDAHDDRA